jgi:predicted DNA-binding transcriptional regulator YafY
MSTAITKLQRWLDLIAYLVGRHHPVTVEELMERIPAYASKWVDGDERSRASVRRTFERDKDELRKLGIPIDTVAKPINFGADLIEGYTLRRRDFYLPYLKLVREAGGGDETASARPPARPAPKPYTLDEVELREAEATAALEALHGIARLPASPFAREARSAFRKLAFDLDPDLFSLDTAAPGTIIYVDRPGAAEVRDRLRPLSAALLARKTVHFQYHGIHRGEVTKREVWPYGLFFQNGYWYLVAHDIGRDDIRLFRVGRMDGVTMNQRAPNTPDYEIPESFRLDDYLRRDPWELGDGEAAPVRARIRFPFPLSLWAERNQYGVLVEELEDGAAIREFTAHRTDSLLRWLLTLEGQAEILEPAELAAELRELARGVVALYQEAGQ